MTPKKGRSGVAAPKRPANEREITPSTYPHDDCITAQRTGQAFSRGRRMLMTYRRRLAAYESDKAKLLRAGLSPVEYEQAVKGFAQRWGI